MNEKIFFDVCRLLPPANEVWGKVIFSETCVSHSVNGGGSLQGDRLQSEKRPLRILLECFLVF